MLMLILIGSLFIPGLRAQDCVNCVDPIQVGIERNWPVEFAQMSTINYNRNHHSSFCIRPPEFVDTIVLHHTATASSETPEKINEHHLARGTAADPWYMIGYSYIINAPYPGAALPPMKITEGRPLEIAGAHAGTDAWAVMDPEQEKIWNDGKVTCGKENDEFTVNPKLVKLQLVSTKVGLMTKTHYLRKIKANISTIGIVVIGNYAPFSKQNLTGFGKKEVRYPTNETLDQIAKLSCQLQKKYPRIKDIKVHTNYNKTECPGNLSIYVGQIKLLTRKYGCQFN